MATSLLPGNKVSIKNSCAHRVLHTCKRVTFPQLRSSASSCRLCSIYEGIVLDCVRGHFPDILEVLVTDAAEEKTELEEMTLIKNHDSLAIRLSDREVIFDVFADKKAYDFEVAGSCLGRKYLVGEYTNSRESFECAQEWVSECLKTHTCPKPGTERVLLPKRLLMVEGAQDEAIRLIETRGDEYPYVCLSHRWGDPIHKQLKTTTRTLESHMNNIEWESLPATFKDAVTVCQSMNVKYLWIDSLCILQSFAEITPSELEATRHDFAQENSNMARTYQNSYFTISADLSDHMNSGFFSRDPVHEYKRDVITDDGSVASIYIRNPLNHYQEVIPSLETRGWTLQGFLLPPRVLHFGAFDITWRCKTCITCGCGHLDRRKRQQAAWHRYHFIERAARPPPDNETRALEWWEQVVHEYTSRQLTNPADKLPALSGLAQQRKQVRGGVYLAGLWQDTLIHDLCWYHVSNYNDPRSGGVGHRPGYYRAPSWSWASVDTDSGCSWWWIGPILLHSLMLGDEPQQACNIVQASCEPSTSDSTGEVRSGYLDIKTSLAAAEITQDPGGQVLWTINSLDPSLRLEFFKPDCALEDDDLNLGDQIFCAPIAGIEIRDRVDCACLALKRIDGDVYQRVGFCTISGSPDLRCHPEGIIEPELENFAWPGSEQVQIRII
ncbi:hypothetical protein FCOIX_7704 [Fusarium coicis]|nr:hypothetical protein FCOIX_7704 [Fusarium coicis]